MPLVGNTIFKQWRRLVLVLAAILTIVANVLVQQSLSKDIFRMEITLNDEALSQLVNNTEAAVTSVASEFVSVATSEASKVRSKAKSVFGDATSEFGDLFLAVPTTTRVTKVVSPTPAPDASQTLVKRGVFDYFNITDSNGVNITDGIEINIKPHTTVDLGNVGEIPILGPILNFLVSLVVSVTPLGLLHLIHLLLLIFGWIYFARLVFRIISASATPPAGKKQTKTGIALKLVSYLPIFKGPQMMAKSIGLVFVPILVAALGGLAFTAQWIDYKIRNHVQEGDFDSFLDLVTVDYEKGPAPAMVRMAMILLYISLVIDLVELTVSFIARFKRKQRNQDATEFQWDGPQATHMADLAKKPSYPQPSHNLAQKISFPQPTFPHWQSTTTLVDRDIHKV